MTHPVQLCAVAFVGMHRHQHEDVMLESYLHLCAVGSIVHNGEFFGCESHMGYFSLTYASIPEVIRIRYKLNCSRMRPKTNEPFMVMTFVPQTR